MVPEMNTALSHTLATTSEYHFYIHRLKVHLLPWLSQLHTL